MTLALLCTVACGQESKPRSDDYSGPRFTSEADHFSVRELPGWSQRRDRGSVLFVAGSAGLTRNTILVRAAPLAGESAEPRTAEVLLPAVEQSLHGLPGARVSAPRELERADFRAVVWDVSFTPAGLGGKRYERRHCLLVGTKFLYHVVATAPAGDLAATADVFASVVDSLREEV